MVKKTKRKTASKVTLAAGLIASTVVPYAIPVGAAEITMTTEAEVTTALNALDPASEGYVEAAEAVIAAYDALIPTEKGLVTTANRTKITNHSKAIVIVAAIKVLPTTEDVTIILTTSDLASITEDITEIKTQYTSAIAAVRTLVKNYSTISALEKAITSQTTYINSLPLLADWSIAFNALPKKEVNLTDVTAEQFATYTDEQKYTTEDLAKITTARTEYNKLTTVLRNFVVNDLPTLVAIEAQVKLQTPLVQAVNANKAAQFTATVTGLNPTSDTYVADVAAVNDAFSKLEPAIAVGVTTATKTTITNHTAAAAIVARIKALPATTAISTLDSASLEILKKTVAEIRANYSSTIAVQRSYVANLTTLIAVEEAIVSRQLAIQYDGELADWKALAPQLNALVLKNYTGVMAAAFGALSPDHIYSTADLALLTTARSTYADIPTAAKKYVTATDLTALTNHEAAAQKQANLQLAYNTISLLDGLAVKNYTDTTAAQFGTLSAAAKYSTADLATISVARQAYTNLADAAKTYIVATEDLATLTTHEAAAEKQANLQLAYDTISPLVGLTVKNFTSMTAAQFGALSDDAKYSTADLASISAVREAYTTLVDTAKQYITTSDLAIIENHEAAVLEQERLTGEYEDLLGEVSEFSTAVNALGEPISFEGITALNYDAATTEKYTSSDVAAIEAVRGLVGELSAPAAALATNDIATVVAHEAAVKKQNELIALVATAKQDAATAYTTAVNALDALTTVASPDSAGYITAVNNITADADLGEGVLALVSTATKNKIANHRAASNVVGLFTTSLDTAFINAIETIDSTSTTTDAQATLDQKNSTVIEARTAYTILKAAEKELVKKFNYSTLTDAEAAITAKQAEISQAATLKPFFDEMAKLPTAALEIPSFTTTLDPTTVTFYTTTDTAAITAARTLHDALDQNLKELPAVASADTLLLAHKAALDEQTTLLNEVAAYDAVKPRVLAFENAVEALTFTVSTTTDTATFYDDDDDVDEKGLINAAHNAYKNLTAPTGDTAVVDAKYIKQDLVDKMNTYVNSLREQELYEVNEAQGAVAALKTKIQGFTTTTDVAYLDTATGEAKSAYEAYETDNDQEALSELASVKTTLYNHYNAISVLKQIEGLLTLPTTSDSATTSDTLTVYINEAQQIRTAFTNLNSGPKSVVIRVNLNKLISYENEAAATKAYLVEKERLAAAATNALSEFVTKMNALKNPNNTSMTTADVISYTTAPTGTAILTMAEPTVYANLTDIRAAITAYNATPAKFNAITSPDAAYPDLVAPTFDNSVDPAMKALIDALIASVNDYDALKAVFDKKAEISTQLSDWTNKFGEIENLTVKYRSSGDSGTVNIITADNVDTSGFEAYSSTADVVYIEDARKAFDELATNETFKDNTAILPLQSYVSTTDTAHLVALEKALAAYTAAKDAKILANKSTTMQNLAYAINALVVTADSAYLTAFSDVQSQVTTMGEAIKAEFDTTHSTEAGKLVDHTAVVNVINLLSVADTVGTINAISTLTALDASEVKVTTADNAYLALSADQETLSIGANVSSTIGALKIAITAKRNALKDVEEIEAWTTAFAELPDFIDFTGVSHADFQLMDRYLAGDIAKIEGLRAIYNGYTGNGHDGQPIQGKVSTADVAHLVKLEADVDLQKQLENQVALSGWTTAFNALPAIIPNFTPVIGTRTTADLATITTNDLANLTTLTTADLAAVTYKYAPTDKNLIDAAATAYRELTVTTDVLASISAQYNKLVQHQEAWDLQAAVETALAAKLANASVAEKLSAFRSALGALKPANVGSYATDFNTAKLAYNALDTANLLGSLTEAETTSYASHAAAVPVVSEIITATNAAAINAATTESALNSIKSALETAATHYNALTTSDDQAKVTNYGTIATALQTVTDKLTALSNATAISAWTTAYNNLINALSGEALDFTDVLASNIGNVVTYSTPEEGLITALRGAYNGFTDEVKGYVQTTQLNVLIAHEEALKTQKRLQLESAGVDPKVTAWESAYAAITSIATIDTSTLTVANYAGFAKYDTPANAKDLINTAIDAYDALTAQLKQLYVTPAQTALIEAFRTSLADFERVEQQLQTAGGLKAWNTAYAALPATTIDTSTLTIVNYGTFAKYPDTIDALIQTAETELGKLSGELQTAHVTTAQRALIADLKASSAAFTQVKQQLDTALQAWNFAYGALPATAIPTGSLTTANYGTFTKYVDGTNAVDLRIKAAESALNNLNPALKTAYVTATQTKLITDLKASVADFKRVEQEIATAEAATAYLKVITDIENLSTASINDALTIQSAYNALSATDKAKIAASLVLKLTNHVNAVNLLNIIAALPTVEQISAMNTTAELTKVRQDISSIRTVYATYTAQARSYVSTYSTLSALETAITQRETRVANEAILITWNDAVDALPGLIDLSSLTPETYTEADGYISGQIIIITTARSVYNNLSAAVKTIIDQADINRLIALESSLAKQKELEVGLITKKATDFTKLVDELDPMASDYVTQVNQMNAQYITFSSDVLAKLSAATKTKVTNHLKAAEMVSQIASINLTGYTALEITAYKNDITAARAAYNALIAAQRTLVKNLAVLTGHEKIAKGL